MRSSSPRSFPAAVVMVATFLTVYDLLGVLFFIPSPSDFRVFYQSTTQWRHGLSPYADVGLAVPNLNHPLLLAVIEPLTYLLFPTAAPVWTMLSILLPTWGVAVAAKTSNLHGWEV